MCGQKNYCIILAGGIGRRLWPCSRRNMPKHFIYFFGKGRKIIQQTFYLFERFMHAYHILFSTYKYYLPIVREQLPELPEANILAEPVQLSTAPAAAWASCHVGLFEPDASIVVTPADQYIVNEQRFEEQIMRGFDFVSRHSEFLAIGVKPAIPNTAYGYIQMDEEGEERGMYRVKSFSEKPVPEYARMFVDSGEFLWNTGLFLWRSSTMLSRIESGLAVFGEHKVRSGMGMPLTEELEIIRKSYPSSMHRSLDLMILEKCENVYVQQADFGWVDLGCWTELYEVAEKDVDGNAVLSDSKVLLSGCRNNLVRLPDGVAAVIKGLDGFLVAQEGNLLVVCPNDDPSLVRRLVNEVQVKLGDEFV